MIHYAHIVAPVTRHLLALDVPDELRTALRLLASERYRESADRLTALAGPHAHHALCAAQALIAYADRDPLLTRRHLDAALEKAPDDATYHAFDATLRLGTDDAPGAIRAYRQALHIDPQLHVAHSLLWSAVDKIGKLDVALAGLRSLLREHAINGAAQGVPPPRDVRTEVESTTLIVADCANPDLALRALRLSMRDLAFPVVKLFTDRAIDAPDITVEPIPTIASHAQYSRFIAKELLFRIETEYVLVAQWDGYVVNASAWTPEFLLYDYVGARWDHAQMREEAHHNVGNGGFSLRSRALLEALQDPRIDDLNPEDSAICRRYRRYLEDKHGIVFADDDTADRFSFEHLLPDKAPFGFHGVTNIARFTPLPGLATLDYLFGPLPT
ncbi:MAG: DUF5672 family protein [Burkholderiales bacterium]